MHHLNAIRAMDAPEDTSSVRKKIPNNHYAWSIKNIFRIKYGSPELCDTCNSMFSLKDDLTRSGMRYRPHHADQQAAKTSALSGCYFCTKLYRASFGEYSYTGPFADYGNPEHFRLSFLRADEEEAFEGIPQNGTRESYRKSFPWMRGSRGGCRLRDGYHNISGSELQS
jgi:hypothetical protein